MYIAIYSKAAPGAHGSTLLGLPSELRLSIYRCYLNSLPTCDTFHLISLRRYAGAGVEEQHNVKTYSFILTLPLLHREALLLVIQTHPILVRSAVDTLLIPNCSCPFQKRIKDSTLDFGICNGIGMRSALLNFAAMPTLDRLRNPFGPAVSSGRDQAFRESMFWLRVHLASSLRGHR